MSVIGAAIWTAGKVVAGAVVSNVVGKALGSDSAQDAANVAQAQAGQEQITTAETTAKSAKELLDFQKQIYGEQKERYERIYGQIETNLGNFYNSITPEILISTGLEDLSKEFDIAREEIGTFIAQRDFGGSGLEAKLFADVEVKEAESRAEVRKEAPFKIAKEKESFLRSGKGLPGTEGVTSAMRGVTEATAGIGRARTSVAQTTANIAQQRANEKEQETRDLLRAGAKEIGFAFGGETV